MPMTNIAAFQIGKSGVTPGIISSLNMVLKNHKHIRIATLPSSGRNRESIKLMAEEITKNVEFQCDYTVIGFKIILRRRLNKIKK